MNERSKPIQTRMLPDEADMFHAICRASGTSASKQLRELARTWMSYQLANGLEFEPVNGDLRHQRVKGIKLIE